MDDQVRAAERQAALSNSPKTQADLLRQKLRSGLLTQEQLDLLVWADYEPAWIVQDYWIHSDHIPGICPCPSCWKGGGSYDWALELKKRWGREVEDVAIKAMLQTAWGGIAKGKLLTYSIEHLSQTFGNLSFSVLNESNTTPLRKAIEEALVNFVLQQRS